MSAKLTSHTQQGPRPYQEDRFIATQHNGITLLAVADGHGGEGCSTHIADSLLTDLVTGKLTPGTRHSILTALADECKSFEEGSTLSLVLIRNMIAHIAIIGDSPVYVLEDNKLIWTAPEHNVRSNDAERQAATSRGGWYSGGYMCNSAGDGLQMSRALGDSHLTFLSTEAEYFTRKLNANSRIIVGSDGIADPSHEISRPPWFKDIEEDPAKFNAKFIVDFVIGEHVHDNATAVTWSPR